MAPIQEAIGCQQMRSEMKWRLAYNGKKTTAQDAALISGDRVTCKNSQYTSKTANAKFETSDGSVKEYRVVSISKGIVEV